MNNVIIFFQTAFFLFFFTCGTVFATNLWITGEKRIDRYAHSSTTLSDGRILVAGGVQDSANVAQCEIYDPSTNSWSNVGSMTTGHSNHTATLLLDGRVLVAGGNTQLTELYDPATDTWSSAGNLSVLRSKHTTTLLQDGRVLVAGGFVNVPVFASSRSVEIYDPGTNTWSTAADLLIPRAEAAAVLLADGRVLVTGGVTSGVARNNSTEIYDPVTNTWSSAEEMIDRRDSHTATLLNNGKVLVAGGYSGYEPFHLLNQCELYDPVTNSWSLTGNMMYERWMHTSNLLSDGRVLVVGSESGSPVSKTAELFSPDTGIWTSAGTLSSNRQSHTTNILPDGRALVIGGLLSSTVEFGDLNNFFSLHVENSVPDGFYGDAAVTLIVEGGTPVAYNYLYYDVLPVGNDVSLTATLYDDTWIKFEGWSGDCSGNDLNCTFNMNENRFATANFVSKKYTVTANSSGNGRGHINSSLGGIDYYYPSVSSATTSQIDLIQPVNLSATANIDSTVSWNDCTNAGGIPSGNDTLNASCLLFSMEEINKSVTATFTLNSYSVLATAGPNGSLDQSTPSPQLVNHGSIAEFTFNADTGYHITSITGCGINFINSNNIVTSKTENTAEVTGECTVNATFSINQYTITATAGQNGWLDSHTPSPQTKECGATAQFTFHANTNYHIASISGCGINFFNSENSVTSRTENTEEITGDCTVNTTFSINTYNLNIGMKGERSGIIISDQDGILCPDDCNEIYDFGEVVTLTVIPGENSKFEKWVGDCITNNNTCTVTMNKSQKITAEFYQFPWSMFLPAIINNQ